MKREQVLLIDGKNMAYRQHYGHLKLRSSEGELSGLLFGFLNEILNLGKRFPDAAQIFCWDGEGKTWRHRYVESYKANRKEVMPGFTGMKAELGVLVPLLREMTFRNPCVEGVEADDLIGVLTKELKKSRDVLIVSNDRDMYQLLEPGVRIYSKGGIITRKQAEEWLGAPLEALYEIRAMAGDSSDNLKGLPGVGLKTAVKLYKQGMRVAETGKEVPRELLKKYSKDLPRVRKEYFLTQIVQDPVADVWTSRQKEELSRVAVYAGRRPGRLENTSSTMRTSLYRVLGRYELDELFKVREKFWHIK